MPTLVYSPSVEIHILTVDNRLIDVTPDIARGTLTRVTRGVSSLSFDLANAMRKYDGVFTPMDRIVCYMRRIRRMLVFSGYLDVVPLFSAYPGTVHIEASCSLKRLQNWFWDPNTAASYNLLYSGGWADVADLTDGGLAARTIKLLTQVAQWPSKAIHIGAVPANWFSAVQKVAQGFINEADKVDMLATVGAQSWVGGQSTTTQGTSIINTGQPGTGQLPATSGKCSDFGGPNDTGIPANGRFGLTGEIGRHPNNSWYCAMRWPYMHYVHGDIVPVPGVNINEAISWWKNRKILVVNPKNNKGVVLRAADWGPADWTGRVIDMSPAGISAIGAVTDDEVHIAFAPADMPLGPVRSNANEAAIGTSITDNATVPNSDLKLGQQIITFAEQYVNKLPYVWGGTSLTTGADCSGFVQQVFKHFNISLPRTSEEQVNVGWQISAAQAGAGDLVFFNEGGDWGHVGICAGDGMMIAAPHTGTKVSIQSIYGGTKTYRRVTSEAGGTVPGLTPSNPTAAAGAAQAGISINQVGEALFNVAQWLGNANFGGDLLTGIRALMNDQPVFATVEELMTAGMRDFCSAPNGDFMAWFPDYFGWYGTAARMTIAPIEIERNFSVGWSDASLKTHWFVTSASYGAGVLGTGSMGGDADQIYQQYGTAGIASVEFPELMRAMFNVDMKEFANNGRDFLARYGARPYWEQMGNISGHRQEFFFAVFRFMQNWAQQYAAQVGLTFMPELWPGMLAVFPIYGVQAYVAQVRHSFDFTGQSGGFTTDISAIAWSAISDHAPRGLPRGAPMPR